MLLQRKRRQLTGGALW